MTSLPVQLGADIAVFERRARPHHRRVVAVVAACAILVVAPATAPATAKVTRGAPPPAEDPEGTENTQDAEVLPACDADRTVVDAHPGRDWATVVLDPARGLARKWSPPDLVDVPSLGRHTDGQVRDFVVDDLVAMHEAATAAEAPFDVVSGFRSGERQARLHDQHIDEPEDDARRDGHRMVAPPGHSEHQLGTTIDVVDPSLVALTAEFADTPAGQWIADHAHEYGFVVSYPEGETEVTCYGWEPWHLRYVGRDGAARVVESGLPLREYLLTAEPG